MNIIKTIEHLETLNFESYLIKGRKNHINKKFDDYNEALIELENLIKDDTIIEDDISLDGYNSKLGFITIWYVNNRKKKPYSFSLNLPL